MSDIVTFGKYKGQSISVLLADKNYVQFAKEKGFFKNFNICVINQSTNIDSPTPEHNRFQNLFLEECYRKKFVNTFFNIEKKLKNIYMTDDYIKSFGNQTLIMKTSVVFEAKFNWDILLNVDFESITSNETDLFKIYKKQQDIIHDEKIKNFELKKDEKNKIYNKYVEDFNIQYPKELEEYNIKLDEYNESICYFCEIKQSYKCNNDGKCKYINKPIKILEKPLEKGLKDECYLKIDFYKKYTYDFNDDFESNHKEYIKNYEEELKNSFAISRCEFYNKMFNGIALCDNYYKKYNGIYDYDGNHLKINITKNSFKIACELKPTIGDEYPCYLRKFNEQREKSKKSTSDFDNTYIDNRYFNNCYYVFAFQKLTADTVSYDQLKEIFLQSNIPIKIIEEDNDSILSRLSKLEIEKRNLNLLIEERNN